MPKVPMTHIARLAAGVVLALATVPLAAVAASAATVPSLFCSSLSWDGAVVDGNVSGTGCDLQSGMPSVGGPVYIGDVASGFRCYITSLTDNGGGVYDVAGAACKRIHPA